MGRGPEPQVPGTARRPDSDQCLGVSTLAGTGFFGTDRRGGLGGV
jgi:hypothetical protein